MQTTCMRHVVEHRVAAWPVDNICCIELISSRICTPSYRHSTKSDSVIGEAVPKDHGPRARVRPDRGLYLEARKLSVNSDVVPEL
jgi:hypothetical protein